MKGFSSLRTARDLREKLRRDLARLKESPRDADAAFNFFVTAEHMLDWVHPGPSMEARQPHISKEREACPLLRLVSHLANGAKHFEAQHRRHKSVEDAPAPLDHWSPDHWTPPHWGAVHPQSPALVVNLTAGAASEFPEYGGSVDVITLAERVMKHWDDRGVPE